MQACFFGQYLVRKGVVTQAELIEAVKAQLQKNKSLGELAIVADWLTDEQVFELNTEQHTTDIFFGELAIERGLLTDKQVDQLMIQQHAKHVSLGDVMVEREIFSMAKLDSLLADFQYYQQRLRAESQGAIKKIPSDGVAQLFLNELVKCLRRICHQKVAIGKVCECNSLPEALSYVGLLELSGTDLEYLGLAFDEKQLALINSCLQNVIGRSSDHSIFAAVSDFLDITCSHAGDKFTHDFPSLKLGDHSQVMVSTDFPSCQHLYSVEMVTEDGGFNAIFMSR